MAINKPTVSALYCDDVRQELGGKTSFMGVYNADILLPAFPATLPKFCVYSTIRLPFESPPKSIIVKVLSGDAVLGELNLPEEILSSAALPPAPDDAATADTSLQMSFLIAFAPLHIQEPTRLRLRTIIDGVEIKGNSLKIRLPTLEERSTLGLPPAQ